MSALQEIAGNIEQYTKKIREAKEKKRYTISDIVDLSGVSKSAVSKLLDGSQMDPKLYNSVAMCRCWICRLTNCSGWTSL